MNGITCVEKLAAEAGDIKIVMLTVYEDNERIFESLKAGAVGYLLKSTSPSEILEALDDVYAGGAPMSAQIARKVVQSFHKPSPADRQIQKLTDRESEVLSLLASGYMYKEIAGELHISMDTVKTYIRNMYNKLQVRTRTEAVVKYLDKQN
ncbi:MAG: response regulator transcription factor [Balneolaceae bacterium]|nr:response regulator transcription factor [Balneolaceae bacterium]